MAFEDDFLANLATAFGLTAEDTLAASIGRIKYMRQTKAYSDALYDRWVMEAMLHAYVEMPLAYTVEKLAGYDPQKLLPHKPYRYDLWDRETLLKQITSVGPYWLKADIDTGDRRWFPINRPPTRHYIEGGHFDMQDAGTIDFAKEHIDFETASPTARRLAPFVSPISELRSRGLTPTGRRIADFVDPRWPKAFDDEDDARIADIAVKRSSTFGLTEVTRRLIEDGEVAYIVVGAHADYVDLERRIMAANIDHIDETITMLPDPYSLFKDFDLPIKGETPKKQPDYLKHDPSKQHRRRRRK